MVTKRTDTIIESLEFGDFSYRRFSFNSLILGKAMTYGVLGFRGSAAADAVRATFYIFHGANGDDSQTLQAALPQTLGAQVVGRLREMGAQFVLPLVDGSFLHHHPTIPSKSYYEYFHREIVAHCEQGTLTQDATRFLVGYSAGGFGALSVFLKSPRRFRGVGAHFPFFPSYDYTLPGRVSEYVARTQAEPGYVDLAVRSFSAVFIDPRDFGRHNPLQLVEALGVGDLAEKRIYFDVGSKDEFGLYEGCRMFHEKLEEKGVPHFYANIAGGKHDAEFLQARFPELMKFLISAV